MPFSPELTPRYHSAFKQLTAAFPLEEFGEFELLEEAPTVDGWSFIEYREDPYKVKTINQELGVFVKWFSPAAAPFAEALFHLTNQLARLDLSVPILAPLAIESGEFGKKLIFKCGEPRGYNRMGYIYSETEIQEIQSVIKNIGLTPLYPRDNISIIKLGDISYVVDPVDDTIYKIRNYLKPKKS